MRKLALGFTAVEMIVVVLIVGVLMSVGAPAFTSMIASNRLSGELNALIGALNVARSEAQKRGATVSVCAGTALTCGTDWSAGWVVLLEGTPRQQLMVRPAVPNGDTITSSVTTFPQFNAAGYTFFTGKLTLRDKDNKEDLARCIVFSAGSWVSKKGAACTT